MNTSTDAGQRAREALASQLEADGRATFAKIIRDHGIAEHDQFDGPLVIRALEAAFASPVTPAAATIPEGMEEAFAYIAETFRLIVTSKKVAGPLASRVVQSGHRLAEIRRNLAAAPIPPATIPGGEREAVSRRLRELVSCIAHDADRSATEAFELIAALTSTGEASDEVLADAGGALPADVARLVIAARMVAWEDPDPETLKELQAASELFASRLPWENEPEDQA